MHRLCILKNRVLYLMGQTVVFGHDTATRWSELEVAECLTASSGVEKLTAQYLHLLKCFCKRKCCLEPVTENMTSSITCYRVVSNQ